MKGTISLFTYIKETFNHIKHNINTIILFELLHKTFGFLILLPVLNFLMEKSLEVRSIDYLDLNGLKTYFFYPQSFIVFLVATLLFCWWLSIEYLFFVTCYNAPCQSLKQTLFHTARQFKQLKKSKLITNILAYLILFIMIYMVTVYSNYTLFTLAFDLVKKSFTLQLILVVTGLVLLWWTSRYLHLVESAEDELVLTKRERKKLQRKTFLRTLWFSLLLILLFSIMFYGLKFLLSVILYVCRYFINYSMIQGVKKILQQLNSAVVFILVPMLLIAFMSTVYDHFKGDKPSFVKKISLDSTLNGKTIKLTGLVCLIYILALFMNTRDFFMLKQSTPKIPIAVAHRGTSIWAPGNSYASIREAIEMNTDYIEIDVQVTNDGIPVLFHDATLSGLNTNSPEFGWNGLKISDLTYDNLQRLTLKTFFPDVYNEKIVSLKDALIMMNNKAAAMIEIKTNNLGDYPKIVEVLKNTDFKSEYYILSFDLETLKYFKNALDCETTLLLTGYVGEIDYLIYDAYVDTLSFEYSAIHSVLVEKIHDVNKKVFVWTINEQDKMVRAIVAGVDGIVTDIPSMVKEQLYYPTKSEFFQIFDVLLR